MTVETRWERFKTAVARQLSPVGNVVLPVFFCLPLAAFVYFRAMNAGPPAETSCGLYPSGACPWAGLPFDYISFQWIAIFSSVVFFGSLGSTVSYFSRQEGSTDGSRSPRSLLGAQVIGAVFALVLLFTFVGGLVQGSLFPSIQADSWSTLFFRLPDWSKLIVWAFIAGFSERFVPDLLNNLILRNKREEEAREQAEAKAASATPDATPGANEETLAANRPG